MQVNFKLVPLQGNFLIDYYPVKLIPGDFILVGTTILIVVLLASWLPARKAALQPFELKIIEQVWEYESVRVCECKELYTHILSYSHTPTLVQ